MYDVRLLLVDANDELLDAYAASLDRRPGISVAGRAHTCAEAVSRAEELAPDIVVLDMSLPDASGLHATRRIKASLEAPHVVLTTLHMSDVLEKEAFAAGADACLSKSEGIDKLVGEIERLARRTGR